MWLPSAKRLIFALKIMRKTVWLSLANYTAATVKLWTKAPASITTH